jgi:hypothetical protein
LLIAGDKESFRWGEYDIHEVMESMSLYESKKDDTLQDSSEPLEPIRNEWVDYFATKIRRGGVPQWQDQPKLWLQIALAYWILVGKCSVSEMKESWTHHSRTVRPH